MRKEEAWLEDSMIIKVSVVELTSWINHNPQARSWSLIILWLTSCLCADISIIGLYTKPSSFMHYKRKHLWGWSCSRTIVSMFFRINSLPRLLMFHSLHINQYFFRSNYFREVPHMRNLFDPRCHFCVSIMKQCVLNVTEQSNNLIPPWFFLFINHNLETCF